MSLKLIVEGGGDRKSKSLNRECRRAFAEFLGKAGLAGRLPSIEAAGGREQAYDAFKSAHARDSRTAVLLVDAEAPVTAPDSWTHLQTRDGWTRPADVMQRTTNATSWSRSWSPGSLRIARRLRRLLPAAVPAAGAARESQPG